MTGTESRRATILYAASEQGVKLGAGWPLQAAAERGATCSATTRCGAPPAPSGRGSSGAQHES